MQLACPVPLARKVLLAVDSTCCASRRAMRGAARGAKFQAVLQLIAYSSARSYASFRRARIRAASTLRPTLAFTAPAFPLSAASQTQGADMNTSFALTLADRRGACRGGLRQGGRAVRSDRGRERAVDESSGFGHDPAGHQGAGSAAAAAAREHHGCPETPPARASAHRQGQPGERSQRHADRSRREQRDAEGGAREQSFVAIARKVTSTMTCTSKGDLP